MVKNLKKLINVVLLSTFFVLNSRILTFIPNYLFYYIDAVFLVFLLIYYGFCLVDVLSKGRMPILFFLVTIPVILPFWSGIRAYFEFGQPLIYGTLVERGIWSSIGSLLLFYRLKHRNISIEQIEVAILNIAWICLIAYLLMTTLFRQDLVNMADLDDRYKGFNASKNETRSNRLRLDTCFIIFAAIYYVISGYLEQKKSQILKAFPFYFYIIVIDQRRAVLFFLITTIFVYLFFSGKILEKIKILMVSAIVLFMLIAFLEIYFPYMIDLFIYAAQVVLTGQETEDGSANARIYQYSKALEYIDDNILLGSGEISSQWEGGGTSGILGYFFPTDIGWLGVLFIWGIIGLLISQIHYFWIIKYYRETTLTFNKAFIKSCFVYSLYYLIYSIPSVTLVIFRPFMNYTILAIFTYTYYVSKQSYYNVKKS